MWVPILIDDNGSGHKKASNEHSCSFILHYNINALVCMCLYICDYISMFKDIILLLVELL